MFHKTMVLRNIATFNLQGLVWLPYYWRLAALKKNSKKNSRACASAHAFAG
jgi:uncharacterized membrane protein